MSNFNTTQNDIANALSQTFPRLVGAENVDWEAIQFAVATLAIRQARLGLTPAEMAYLMTMHLNPDGALIVDAPSYRLVANPETDSILLSLHKKGLVSGESFNDENTDKLPHLTDLGLAVCEWLLQPFGYRAQSTTYTPEEIIAELNTTPKEAHRRTHKAPRLTIV